MAKSKSSLRRSEPIEQAILFLRGQKVLLDRDLAKLYGIPTKVLNQAVQRNSARFSDGFMLELDAEEFQDWRSQIVTSNSAAKMGVRRRHYAFTEKARNRLPRECVERQSKR